MLEKVPFREDGTLDINEIMRLELERIMNAIMDAQETKNGRPKTSVDFDGRDDKI